MRLKKWRVYIEGSSETTLVTDHNTLTRLLAQKPGDLSKIACTRHHRARDRGTRRVRRQARRRCSRRSVVAGGVSARHPKVVGHNFLIVGERVCGVGVRERNAP